MENIKYHNLPLLPPEKDVIPPLKLITAAYHAVGELKGRMYRDVINPNLIVGYSGPLLLFTANFVTTNCRHLNLI